MRQVVELKTSEMVSQDLDRYHGALDRALMAFHASKMSDINKVSLFLFSHGQLVRRRVLCTGVPTKTALAVVALQRAIQNAR